MSGITSVPHLLARAMKSDCVGGGRCYYCGAPSGDKFPVATYVKDSFTGRTGVIAPGSPSVCKGCVICLRESASIKLIDGEQRTEQRMRGYSWLITSTRARAMTKAHFTRIRKLCLSPPEPPFAIVLSDSGQTHQLYRGRVNHATSPVTVTLEAEPVTFAPHQLAELVPVAGKICAASGKPALSVPITPSVAIRVIERYRDGEALVHQWTRHGYTGIGRLAAWLTPKKEVSESDYPSDREAPAQARARA